MNSFIISHLRKKPALVPAFLLIISISICGCRQTFPDTDTSLNTTVSPENPETSSPYSEEADTTEAIPENTSGEPDTTPASNGVETSEAEISDPEAPETSAVETESQMQPTDFTLINATWYLTTNTNIRTEPSLNSEIYDVFPAGTALHCIGTSPDWTAVTVGSNIYYVSTPLLTSTPPETSTEESPQTPDETETSSTSTGNSFVGVVTANGILYAGNSGPLVCIDAGHQAHGNSDTEPNGPGSTVYKAKVSTGTSGCTTGLAESALNLIVSCKLRDELLARGYQVLMIRESQDVDLSNAERAQMANAAGADIFIRVHANGSDDTNISGALTMCPTAGNPYPIAALYSACYSLSAEIVNGICQTTGAVNRGVYQTDTMSGINWCAIPVTIVEMGYMTNPTEDTLMASDAYQNLIVTGIANGVDRYFGR